MPSPAELIQACAQTDDAEAWRALIARFQRPIGLSIIRVAKQWGAFPKEVVDDLIQETYLKLCTDRGKRLYQFSIEHPSAVEAYMKTVAIRVAHDYFKAHHSQKRGGRATSQMQADPNSLGEASRFGGAENMQREVLLREIDSYLDSNSNHQGKVRDRLIFWLHYKYGLSANSIAAMPAIGLTVKGVESAIVRLTRLVRGRMQLAPFTRSE